MKDNQKRLMLGYIVLSVFIIIVLFSLYKFTLSKPNSDIDINVSDKVTYTAYFKINGATYLEKEKGTCKFINNQCIISMPVATRENGEVLGYNTNKESHDVLYKIYDYANLTSDITFYVISKNDLQLQIIGDEIKYLTNQSNTCAIYNEEDSCSIKLPFYNKEGYELRGYSTNKNSLTGFIYPNNEFEIKDNTILYPIYGIMTRGQRIDVKTSIFVNNMAIDIENGCDENIYNNYLDYFKRIIIKAPYLSIGSKIAFLKDETFDNVWGESYVGMNYGPKNLRLIDVRCSDSVNNNYYATIIHEMAHAWDFYYGSFLGKDIAEQPDIINLFNNYKSIENRPFRTYSYTNIREFVADMVRYYYLKYVDPVSEYAYLSYPSDIKQVLEKYICISSNNYNNSSCEFVNK